MLLSVCLCLILACAIVSGSSGDECPARERKNAEENLRTELFADTTLIWSPINDFTKPINVTLVFSMNSLRLIRDDSNEFLSLDVTTTTTWVTPCLKWNSSQHDDITSLTGVENYIWTPNIFMDSTFLRDGLSLNRLETCIIWDGGDIVCSCMYNFMLPCRVESYWLWPFDKKHYELLLSDAPHDEQNVNVTFHDIPVEKTESGWSLKKFQFKVTNITTSTSIYKYKINKQINISLEVERNSDIFIYIVSPILVAIVLAISSLTLHIYDPNKARIATLSLGLHIYIFTMASNVLPKNMAGTPMMFLVLRDSLVLNGLILVTSLISYSLYRRVDSPSYLVSTFSRLMRSRASKIVFYQIQSEHQQLTTEDQVVEPPDLLEQNNEVWVQLACFINSLLIVVISFSYFIYLCIFFNYLVRIE